MLLVMRILTFALMAVAAHVGFSVDTNSQGILNAVRFCSLQLTVAYDFISNIDVRRL